MEVVGRDELDIDELLLEELASIIGVENVEVPDEIESAVDDLLPAGVRLLM